MEWSEETAVAGAKGGDADAFRALVERHSRSLFRLAYRMTGSEHDAEDVVQESLLRAFRQIGSFDERSSFGTWLYRIGVNCSLDAVRSRKRRLELPAGTGYDDDGDPLDSVAAASPAPDRMAMSGEARGRIGKAMAKLSPSERTAFVLRHFEGMRIDEVSKVLGCEPGAAKHSVFRAVRKLRRALEPLVSTAR